jgi:hypothetical protein
MASYSYFSLIKKKKKLLSRGVLSCGSLNQEQTYIMENILNSRLSESALIDLAQLVNHSIVMATARCLPGSVVVVVLYTAL